MLSRTSWQKLEAGGGDEFQAFAEIWNEWNPFPCLPTARLYSYD